MVLRQARGRLFWGCAGFPRCRGALTIPKSEQGRWWETLENEARRMNLPLPDQLRQGTQ
jgi:ssDNA-binding Zn-finger/Zn-ribbon topoisomerase 1